MPGKRDLDPSQGFFDQSGDVEQRHNGKTRPETSNPVIEGLALTANGAGVEASNDAWDLDALRTEDSEHSATQDAGDFDLDALRLSQDFDEEVVGKKLLTTVPVRKPKRQEFVRVHPDPDWQIDAALLEVEEDRESYLVVAALQKALANEVQPVHLVTAMSRSGVLFLWPVKRSKGGRKDMAWHTSAQTGARLAQQSWIKIKSNMDVGAYEITQAASHIPDPEWPTDLTFQEVVKLAFKDRIIADLQHPVLRRLRGEI